MFKKSLDRRLLISFDNYGKILNRAVRLLKISLLGDTDLKRSIETVKGILKWK